MNNGDVAYLSNPSESFDNLEVLASYFVFNFHSQPINPLFFRALALPSSFTLIVQTLLQNCKLFPGPLSSPKLLDESTIAEPNTRDRGYSLPSLVFFLNF